jgi:hypothetical protein
MANTVGIKFLYSFSVGEYNTTFPGLNVISVSSTYPGHDKLNLTTTPLRETWRSNTILTTQEIIIEANDLNTVPDVFAILNHNLTDLAVVQLQASLVDPTFLAPAFTINLQWNKKHIALVQDLGLPYRYYKIKITDPTNPCGFIEIGKIVAGKAFTFTNNEDITDRIGVSNDDLSYKMKSEGFFRAANERVKVQKLSLRFQNLTTVVNERDNYEGLLEMLDEVGETLPFLTIVDPGEPYFKIVWGILDNMPSETYDINRYVDMPLSIQEVY